VNNDNTKSKPQRKTGLGRGLSALLGDSEGPTDGMSDKPDIQSLPVEFLVPNPDQPRRNFDAEEMTALADSIQQKGIIQPILVRCSPEDPAVYQIVAGERRWRAAQQARIHTVPVIVRDLSDSEVLEIAIIENVQRSDLNAMEEAAGYARLVDHFGYTQEKLAKAMGKSRSHIANMMRLLSLNPPVRKLVETGKLTAGHARALVSVKQQDEIAQVIVKKNLTVRDAERLAKTGLRPAAGRQAAKTAPKDPDTRSLERDLTAALGVKVQISHLNPQGDIRLHYENLDQLDEICRRLCQSPQAVSDF